jgi:hypothetical protein
VRPHDPPRRPHVMTHVEGQPQQAGRPHAEVRPHTEARPHSFNQGPQPLLPVIASPQASILKGPPLPPQGPPTSFKATKNKFGGGSPFEWPTPPDFGPNSIFPSSLPPFPSSGGQFRQPLPSKQFKRNPASVQDVLWPPPYLEENFFQQNVRATRGDQPPRPSPAGGRGVRPAAESAATAEPQLLPPPPKQQEISQRVEATKEQTDEKPTIIEVSAMNSTCKCSCI